jgi:hypothetical protein
VKIESMTIRQILEMTDSQLEALSEKEQRTIADVIGAVLDFELRRGSCARLEDPRKELGQVLQHLMPGRNQRHKLH